MSTNTPAVASTASTALAALGNLKAGLQNVMNVVRVAGSDPILKLGRNDGVWTYGQENIEVEEGSKWAVNPLSIRYGLVCWKVRPTGSKAAAELYGKHIRLPSQPPLDPMSLQAKDSEGNDVDHNKHPWVEFIGVDLKCVSGEDAGVQCPYEPSSDGGLRGLRELIANVMKQLDADPTHPVPVVLLKSDSYDNKTYGGKTWFPVFPIQEWMTLDGVTSDEAPEPQPETAAPPAQTVRRGRQAAPQEQPANTNSQPDQDASAAAASGGVGERRRSRR
jgi:hypothetical protein